MHCSFIDLKIFGLNFNPSNLVVLLHISARLVTLSEGLAWKERIQSSRSWAFQVVFSSFFLCVKLGKHIGVLGIELLYKFCAYDIAINNIPSK